MWGPASCSNLQSWSIRKARLSLSSGFSRPSVVSGHISNNLCLLDTSQATIPACPTLARPIKQFVSVVVLPLSIIQLYRCRHEREKEQRGNECGIALEMQFTKTGGGKSDIEYILPWLLELTDTPSTGQS
jgi:hypothetical protein